MQNHQLLSIGNALVDILAPGTDELLGRAGISKGAMTLVGDDEASRIYGLLGSAVETSGGSAANTASGFVALGGTCVYAGRTGDDALGAVFRGDIAAQGVTFGTEPAEGRLTGRSVIVVTPDGERSMSTHLGACTLLREKDVDPAFDLLGATGIVFLEGYLWDAEGSRAAARHAASTASARLHPAALTLSDPSCVARWRDEFVRLVEEDVVGLVFANEKEFAAYTGETDPEKGYASVGRSRATFVVTRGSEGCVVLHSDGAGGRAATRVKAAKVDAVVDTTGAGDMFAAGYLRGVVAGLVEEDCARLGASAAASVIRRTGARARFDEGDRTAFADILSRGAPVPPSF